MVINLWVLSHWQTLHFSALYQTWSQKSQINNAGTFWARMSHKCHIWKKKRNMRKSLSAAQFCCRQLYQHAVQSSDTSGRSQLQFWSPWGAGVQGKAGTCVCSKWPNWFWWVRITPPLIKAFYKHSLSSSWVNRLHFLYAKHKEGTMSHVSTVSRKDFPLSWHTAVGFMHTLRLRWHQLGQRELFPSDLGGGKMKP